MVAHIGFPVSNRMKTRTYYTATLRPFGIGAVTASPGGIEFGTAGQPQLRFGSDRSPPRGIHLGFTAADRAHIQAFYAAATAAGAPDNGVPGLRPHCHPNYDRALVPDPGGHNVEAVCHNPED
jgi:catechol 2,3-dioxygenase-like lactoylglutathione lyase family enzyme